MGTLWTFGDSFTAGHGCRFQNIEPFSNENQNSYYYKTYKDFIDINRKIWPETLAESINFQLKNCGINGLTNESIFDNTLKNVTNFSKEDLVILQSSTVGRFDFPFLREKSLFGYSNNNRSKNNEIYSNINSPYFFKTIFISNIEKEWDENCYNVLQYTNAQESIKDKNILLSESKYNTIRNFFAEFINTKKYYERSIWMFIELSKILTSIGVRNYLLNEDVWPDGISKPNNLIEMHDRGITGYLNSNKKTIYHKTNGLIDDFHPNYEGHDDIAEFILNFIENENIDLYNA